MVHKKNKFTFLLLNIFFSSLSFATHKDSATKLVDVKAKSETTGSPFVTARGNRRSLSLVEIKQAGEILEHQTIHSIMQKVALLEADEADQYLENLDSEILHDNFLKIYKSQISDDQKKAAEFWANIKKKAKEKHLSNNEQPPQSSWFCCK